MLHDLIELAILLLVAYFAGTLIGYLLRKLIGSENAAPAEVAVTPSPPAPAAAAMPAVAPQPARRPVEAVAAAPAVLAAEDKSKDTGKDAGKVERPKGIAAARGGKPDKLQRISGIGPKNEKILHGLGFFHFDQIAAWTKGQVSWVDDHLRFNGRIARENWIRQARLLADGKEAEFTRLYGNGGVRPRKT